MSNVSLPNWLSSTLASDARKGLGVLPRWIRPLDPAQTLIARAHVVNAGLDDNLVINQLIQSPPEAGRVLVVSGHAQSTTSTIGDLMARELQLAGVVGLITDGLIRDARDIRQIGFPVWCRGSTPSASSKLEEGSRGGVIQIGGQVIREGDWLIADEDGSVVWPAGDVETLLEAATRKRDQDDERLARLIQLKSM